MEAHPNTSHTNLFALLRTWLHPLQGDLPELYVVGGAVRDSCLGRPFRDVDLACFEPDIFSARLAAIHGAVRVPFLKHAETPCYRVVKPGFPDDYLDVAGLPQDTPRSKALQVDLQRRDFTINAMAYAVAQDGSGGEIIDPFGGRQDLVRKQIRLVSAWGFQDDPARLFRAVRFATGLDFEIQAGTLELMRRDAHLASLPASERIIVELGLTMETGRGLWAVRLLDDTGALSAILPECDAMHGCVQNGYHHLDVWEHSLLVLETVEQIIADPAPWLGKAADRFLELLQQENNMATLKLAALLHDVGKPKARFWNQETERYAFHRHQQIGAEMIVRIANRLKMRRFDANQLQLLVSEHMRPFELSTEGVKHSTLMRWIRRMRSDLLLCLCLAHADNQATRGPEASEKKREALRRWIRNLAESFVDELEEKCGREPMVRGQDLLDMGIPTGPDIGQVLRRIEEARDDNLVTTREQALRMASDLVGELKSRY